MSFSNGNANNGSEGHPTPDPLLLVSKAVINLQKRNGFEFAVLKDAGDEHYRPSGEESIQAQEEYLLRERQEDMKCKYRDPIGFDVTIVNASNTEDTTMQACRHERRFMICFLDLSNISVIWLSFPLESRLAASNVAFVKQVSWNGR